MAFEPSDKYLDDDGYPSPEELQSIIDWPIHSGADIAAAMAYVGDRWNWGDKMWIKRPRRYRPYPGATHLVRGYVAHTGGWSGNESLIYAMEQNYILWGLIWRMSERGGHYTFEVYEDMA